MTLCPALLVCFISACCAQEELIRVLDTRGDFVGRTEGGEVELNQAILSKDLKGNLPEEFTICAATFLANWISNFAWFDLLKEDGSHWAFFYQKIKNLDQDSSQLIHSLWMNVNGAYYYLADFGPFEFNRWVHLCVGFNLNTGVVSAVADGTVMPDKEVVGLGEGKPSSLAERLILGKSNRGGKWKQDSVLVSSVEVFQGILDKTEMVSRSQGKGCGGPGDYLSWSQVAQESSVNFVVDGVEASRSRDQVEEHKEEGALQERHSDPVCEHGQDNDGSGSQVGSQLKAAKSFARLCSRMQGSKMVGPATSNEATELQNFFKQTVMDETDGKWIPFPGGCSSYWLPFSDQV